MEYELAILGAGNMAEAIVRGVLRVGRLSADQIVAADVSAVRRQVFAEQLQVKAMESNEEAAGSAKVVLLSVKPQQMQAALSGVGRVLSPAALVLSIAAGIGTKFIATALGKGTPWRVVRAMPNTPMLVGEGMVAIAPGAHATPADMATARQLFEAAARVVEVDETKIDAVTAVSGSGPAYFFYLVEQMIRAGVEMGLSVDQAGVLARQTALGAARMLVSSDDSPEELRRKVTSPGGTTQAAIETLDARGVAAAVVDALHAAQRRGRELGND